mgnify:CR=1 FL=1
MNDVDRLSFFTMLFKSDNISQFDVLLYKTFLISDNSIQLLLLSVLIFNYYKNINYENIGSPFPSPSGRSPFHKGF